VHERGPLTQGVGSSVLVGAGVKQRTRSLATLGVASAAVLLAADDELAGKGRISPVYFGDAAIEAVMIATWTLW
jgi:hypothetical protein